MSAYCCIELDLLLTLNHDARNHEFKMPYYPSMLRCSVLWLVLRFLMHDQKVKVKVTLVQALRLCTGHMAHRGSRVIALPFLDYGTRKGSASHPGRSLPLGKTRYSLYRRLGGPQGRSGQVRKITPPPGFDPQTGQAIASHFTDYGTWRTHA